jgi:TatD DNase family protein
MNYVDFHTHTDDINLYDNLKIYTLINCMTLEEVLKWLPVSTKSPYIKLSIGCHPNHPELIDALLPYYKYGHVVGEIGLDNCWSQAPLEDQRQSFIKSLKEAQILNKPIILHTKGMEAEIFEILKNYDMPKIIHWYSGPVHILEKVKLESTFFTIGPDVLVNKDVQKLLAWLPVEKILVETDGLEALEWVSNERLDESAILNTLKSTLEYISKVKKVDERVLKKKMLNFFKSL